MEEKKQAAYRIGVIIFIVLAVLTAVEYVVGLQPNTTVILFIIALIKAGLVVQYFMHVSKLWSEEGSH
jgi:cytochrome c oxidase subunit 4